MREAAIRMDDVEALGVMVVCNNVGGARSEGSPVLGVPVVSDGFVDAPSRDETVLVVGLVCVAGIILDNAAVAGSKSRADAAMLLAASAAAAAATAAAAGGGGAAAAAVAAAATCIYFRMADLTWF